jgi:hypothetical protein
MATGVPTRKKQINSAAVSIPMCLEYSGKQSVEQTLAIPHLVPPTFTPSNLPSHYTTITDYFTKIVRMN